MIVYFFIYYSIYKTLSFVGNKNFNREAGLAVLSLSILFYLMDLIIEIEPDILKKSGSQFFVLLIIFLFFINYKLLFGKYNKDKYEQTFEKTKIHLRLVLIFIAWILLLLPFFIFMESASTNF